MTIDNVTIRRVNKLNTMIAFAQDVWDKAYELSKQDPTFEFEEIEEILKSAEQLMNTAMKNFERMKRDIR